VHTACLIVVDLPVSQLLSPHRKPPSPASSTSIDSACSPTLPVGDELCSNGSASHHTVMYIDILPERSPDMIRSENSSLPRSDTGDVIRASDYPRQLKSINPTISFTSPSRIVARARFTVHSEDLIVHTENVPLLLLPDHPQSSGFVYTTKLVPKYWQVLLDSPGAGINYVSVSQTDTAPADPTRFIISQEVVKESNSTILFSATYKFRYSGGRHNPQPDLAPSDIMASNRLTSVHGDPYTAHEGAARTPLLPYSRTHCIIQRDASPLASPGSDSSSASGCFPVDLSHYVH
jgi:transcriptional enhancer factor